MRIVLVLLVAVVSRVASQAAVVKHAANLRDGPGSSFAIKGHVDVNDEVSLLEPAPSANYLHVRTAAGVPGWVYAPYLRVLTGPAAAPVGPPELYHGCPLEGNASQANRQAANRLKNRVVAPAATDIDGAITLQAVLQPGDDAARWHATQGARLVGFVVNVKSGSSETVNCGDSEAGLDTHIEITSGPTATAKNQRVIVEITPRWRTFMSEQHGEDWSTDALKTRLLNHWVEFTGWMFFDGEHDDEAENTRPGRAANWRATAWEIHPITALRVVNGPD